jgi:hypothetical protein
MPTSESTYYEKQGPSLSSSQQNELRPVPDLVTYLKDYAKANPEQAALWIFGAGFILGWKLKPW